jgi:hypothetical protein
MPFGPLGRLVHWLKVQRDLKYIFEYRASIIEEQFGTAKEDKEPRETNLDKREARS